MSFKTSKVGTCKLCNRTMWGFQALAVPRIGKKRNYHAATHWKCHQGALNE